MIVLTVSVEVETYTLYKNKYSMNFLSNDIRNEECQFKAAWHSNER